MGYKRLSIGVLIMGGLSQPCVVHMGLVFLIRFFFCEDIVVGTRKSGL